MKEIWKDIEGFEGLYQVSNLGRVKSLERVIIRKNGRKIPCREKNLTSSIGAFGYYRVNLCKNGRQFTKKIHTLVAEHFIGKRPEGYDVNHIDENKANNAVSNLEYVTRKENINHATRNIRSAKTKGKPVLGISLDGKHAMTFWSTKEAARHGFDRVSIRSCCDGKYKQHKGYTWRWLDE